MRGSSSWSKTVKMASQLNFQDIPIPSTYISSRWEGLKNWASARRVEISFACIISLALIGLASVNYQNQVWMSSQFGTFRNETIADIKGLLEKTAFHSKAASAQSCRELYEHGFTESGYYLVDPDGRYTGQTSFEVFCERAYQWYVREYNYLTKIIPKTRTFNISSQLSEDFNVKIDYNATSQQIQALIENSGTCYQEITFECLVMPLHFEEINHGYWKDRFGTERYFFDGIDYKGRKCECSNTDDNADNQCQSSKSALCNCDLRSKFNSKDKGTIQAQWILPITEFGYKFHGHSLNTFNAQNGSATVTIGDLICKGMLVTLNMY